MNRTGLARVRQRHHRQIRWIVLACFHVVVDERLIEDNGVRLWLDDGGTITLGSKGLVSPKVLAIFTENTRRGTSLGGLVPWSAPSHKSRPARVLAITSVVEMEARSPTLTRYARSQIDPQPRAMERGYCKINFRTRPLICLAAKKQKRRNPLRNQAFSMVEMGDSNPRRLTCELNAARNLEYVRNARNRPFSCGTPQVV